MPSSTAIWSRPVPVATDSPAVHTDITSLANSLDSTPLYPATMTTSATAAAGLSYVVSASLTLTLPASPTKGDIIRASAASAVTGATAVTVTASGGKGINGIGLAAASSFTLGTPFSHATLQYDGTNWQIIDGQRDTGWTALTLINSATSTSGYTPSVRLQGDVVRFKGTVTVTSNPTFATLAATFRPGTDLQLAVGFSGSISSLTAFHTSGSLVGASTSGTYSLDSITYSLS